MKAVVATSKTTRELKDIEQPSPNGSEVRIKIIRASINPVDFKFQEGSDNFPYVMGIDGAGYIDACGDSVNKVVDGLDIGTPVYFHNNLNCKHGTFAEYAIVDARSVIPIPHDMSMDIAALPCVAFTALQAVKKAISATEIHGLPSRPCAFIGGLSSSVGHQAVKLLVDRGWQVAGSCRTHRIQECKQKTGAFVVDADSDFGHETASMFPNGFNIAIDCVNGDSAAKLLPILSFGGCVVPVVGMNFQSENLNSIFLKGITIAHVALGFVAYNSPFEEHLLELKSLGEEILSLVQRNVLDFNIGHRIKLEDVPEYLTKLKQRTGISGKIVVEMD
ncbi:hypothetical protein GEMRC1_002168 [Eukaryota sp. GEM-RC1]